MMLAWKLGPALACGKIKKTSIKSALLIYR